MTDQQKPRDGRPADAESWGSVALAGSSEEEFAVLEQAAEAGNETAFVRQVRQMDWSCRLAREFAQAVRLALAAGAHLSARELATAGVRKYQDDLMLQRMAHILAPPRVVRADLPADSGIRADQEWIRAHADEYQGQWVALRSGTLVAAARTPGELKAAVGSLTNITVTRIY